MLKFLVLFSALYISFPTAYLQAADTGPKDAGAPPQMVLIPADDFLMGSSLIKSEQRYVYPPEETPRHKVELDAYYIDKYEVTNGEFAEFLNSRNKDADFETRRQRWVVIRNDLQTDARKDWWPTQIEIEDGRYRAVPGFEKYPTTSVSWFAADEFCRWRGKRLPTEAEWEKAARGGMTDTDYPWGNALPTGGVIFKRSWKRNELPVPVEAVGNHYPNGYGIFDMAGNVSEWCADWYDPSYYGNSPRTNPAGPSSGSRKVIRGGSWASFQDSLRVAARSSDLPANMPSGTGIRCARDARSRQVD